MATCERESPYTELDLPPEFADLAGLLQTDLHAIVAMVTQRANERLLLTRREQRRLQKQLWNGLTDVVHRSLEPLAVENR